MHIERHAAPPSERAATTLVLLPAAYQRPAELVAAGFVTAIRQRALPVDLLLIDPGPLVLSDRSWLPHLRSECVLAARRVADATVWFAGISLGGFLAMLYAARYPNDAVGLCLITPYLGSRVISSEIAGYATLEAWSLATAAWSDEFDEERRVWRFIERHAAGPQPWYLGFGSQDRFVAAQRLLAAQLPAACVHEIEGAHDWPVWQQLWNDFLDRLATPARAAP